MNSPIILLFISTIILGLIVWFFWPDKGIYTLIKKGKRNTKRVLIVVIQKGFHKEHIVKAERKK